MGDSRGYPLCYPEPHADSVYDESLRGQQARFFLECLS